MAALTTPPLDVRAPREGDGAAVAALWRELWEVHEGWGGYRAQRDGGVYESVARRIESEARVRFGQPVLGRHVHLVATQGGAPCGQVEGWFDRLGSGPETPFTCEVRSLIVASTARGTGAGSALLDELATWSRRLARGAPSVLAAEVLASNPALAFYERLGFQTVSHGCIAEVDARLRLPFGAFTVRRALREDAPALAVLDRLLATRRKGQGDPRFDGPAPMHPLVLQTLADYLGRAQGNEPTVELLAVDGRGSVRASATFATFPLEAPFVAGVRAVLGRVSADPVAPAHLAALPLAAAAFELARQRGAQRVEFADLPGPGIPLHDVLGAAGARPWSRIVCRPVRATGAFRALLRGGDSGSV